MECPTAASKSQPPTPRAFLLLHGTIPFLFLFQWLDLDHLGAETFVSTEHGESVLGWDGWGPPGGGDRFNMKRFI